MCDKTYNGHTNYETRCVGLWLENDEGTYHMCRDMVKSTKRQNHVYGEYENDDEKQAVLNDVAAMLKDYVEELAPPVEGLFADLQNAALGEVDWIDVAEGFTEE